MLREFVRGLFGGARQEVPPDLPYVPSVRQVLLDGDVLLFQGTSPFSRLIRWAGRTRYSHVGIVVLGRGGRVLVAEAREGLVGSVRLVPLSNAVKGGTVDLYRVRGLALDQLDDVARTAEAYLGQAYGWASILRMGCAHLPLFLLRKLPVVGHLLGRAPAWSDNDREPSALSMVCSEYVSRCFREGARVDLVPNLADHSTEPGDLARSALLEPLGALVYVEPKLGTTTGPAPRLENRRTAPPRG